MKRCPKCHVDNDDDALTCKNCPHEFEIKENNKCMDKEKDESEDWPSDEWKDWNLM